METLHISLLDGFEDEVVILKVNDQEVYHKKELFSKLIRGYADSLEVQVDEGEVKVEFILPERNLEETITLKILSPIYLGLSIHHDKIQYKASLEPLIKTKKDSQ